MTHDSTQQALQTTLPNEAATLAYGARLAKHALSGLVICLHGNLGAGKTCFTRGFLQQLGHFGKVKSPSYTLVEPYRFINYNVYHFDLYRFTDEQEWEEAGFREYFNPQSICIIEWPEKARHVLPEPDIDVRLSLVTLTQGTLSDSGRHISIAANTQLGKKCLEKF